MTEGLSAEVMAEAEKFGAGDPSVLTADRVCEI
nr:MAG TPA: Musculoskeletal, temporally activated-embryonic nuclear protein 1 [Caudoviricetes sp.]